MKVHGEHADAVTFSCATTSYWCGIDADVFYAVNFDLGTNITGYMKYTF